MNIYFVKYLLTSAELLFNQRKLLQISTPPLALQNAEPPSSLALIAAQDSWGSITYPAKEMNQIPPGIYGNHKVNRHHHLPFIILYDDDISDDNRIYSKYGGQGWSNHGQNWAFDGSSYSVILTNFNGTFINLGNITSGGPGRRYSVFDACVGLASEQNFMTANLQGSSFWYNSSSQAETLLSFSSDEADSCLMRGAAPSQTIFTEQREPSALTSAALKHFYIISIQGSLAESYNSDILYSLKSDIAHCFHLKRISCAQVQGGVAGGVIGGFVFGIPLLIMLCLFAEVCARSAARRLFTAREPRANPVRGYEGTKDDEDVPAQPVSLPDSATNAKTRVSPFSIFSGKPQADSQSSQDIDDGYCYPV